MTRLITLQEVKEHSSPKSLWLIIHGKVYDCTKYIDSHPGGEVILDGAGTDATDLFEDIGHSSDARDILKEFYIGDLAK